MSSVPQPLIHAIAPGQTAQLTFQELPGRTFDATVTRTAGAVDPASRTLQVELQVANPNGEILAGSYAQVRFNEAADAHGADAFRQCADFPRARNASRLVGSDNKVQLRSVKLGRDFGNTVEVLDGLDADDRVINNPPDSIADGMTVQIAQPAETNIRPNENRSLHQRHRIGRWAWPVAPSGRIITAPPRCPTSRCRKNSAAIPVRTNQGIWKIAEPSADLPRGEWWQVFNDAELNRLETLALTNNQNLAAAVARFEAGPRPVDRGTLRIFIRN